MMQETGFKAEFTNDADERPSSRRSGGDTGSWSRDEASSPAPGADRPRQAKSKREAKKESGASWDGADDRGKNDWGADDRGKNDWNSHSWWEKDGRNSSSKRPWTRTEDG